MTKTTKKTNKKAVVVASQLPDPSGLLSKGAAIRLTPELRKALMQAVACCREIAGVGQREGGTLSDYEVDSLAAANEIERMLEPAAVGKTTTRLDGLLVDIKALWDREGLGEDHTESEALYGRLQRAIAELSGGDN
jgi:hypothetical protein